MEFSSSEQTLKVLSEKGFLPSPSCIIATALLGSNIFYRNHHIGTPVCTVEQRRTLTISDFQQIFFLGQEARTHLCDMHRRK